MLAPAEGASVALQVLLAALSGARFWCEICPLCSLAGPEVNISSYPATSVAGSFFFRRAEILNLGGFVQKYWSVTAARYCYVLSSRAPRLFGFYQTKPSCSENFWKL